MLGGELAIRFLTGIVLGEYSWLGLTYISEMRGS
jgi:hypothetical protein